MWDPERSAGAIQGDARQPRQRTHPEHGAARHHAGTLPATGGRVNLKSAAPGRSEGTGRTNRPRGLRYPSSGSGMGRS